jgi:NAD(P)-dependent dehydrogenase (short-subunit alcohol dehydrogenase family)
MNDSTNARGTGGLRGLLLRPSWAAPADLRGKTIVVTGTAPNSIGYETARILAGWGADIVVSTRANTQAVVEALRASGAKGRVEGHALDLADADSVRRFAARVLAQHGERLDVLVNNAGIHLDLLSQWQQPHLADGQEIHWRTNYLGSMHLTALLLPALLDTANTTGDARVVNVVSMLHARGSNAGLFAPQEKYNSWVAYGLSKLALIHATFELQRRHGAAGLRAYCLHPGAVYTNIANQGLAGNPLIEALRRGFAPMEKFFLLTPEEGAQTQVHCATAPGAPGGLYYRNGAPAPASAETRDAQAAGRLWEETQRWIAAQSA